MTNKEQLDLIAQARELCEEQIREVIDEVKWHHTSTEDITAELNARKELNSWTTHLAEMDEHKEGYKRLEGNFGYVNCVGANIESLCVKCSDSEQQPNEYPCDFLVTKAKRLLGVTTDA